MGATILGLAIEELGPATGDLGVKLGIQACHRGPRLGLCGPKFGASDLGREVGYLGMATKDLSMDTGVMGLAFVDLGPTSMDPSLSVSDLGIRVEYPGTTNGDSSTSTWLYKHSCNLCGSNLYLGLRI